MTAVLAQSVLAQGEANLTVRVDQPGHAVSETMYGIFFEDINYGADGGLYAELIENRSFEHADWMHAWKSETRGAAAGRLTLSDEAPVHPNNPRYVRLDITAPGEGIGLSNSGYGGISVSAGAEYRFAVHARARDGFTGALRVSLEAEGGKALAEARVTGLSADWTRYRLALKAAETHHMARLVVLADAPGRVEMDMISLFPKDTWNQRENGLRADMVRILADMKPGFMRFPGGCIVEGKDLANAYRWKDTVGDVATRKQNWNRWQSAMPRNPSPHYHQTYGLGFYEFFLLCEDIGAVPVPVLNCGMSCQYQDGQLVPLDALGPWVQDALDLVEFANGPPSSPWGKLRAEMGHPEPFRLRLLGIGNEQWGEEYFKRYAIFQRALKAEYPDITLITTSGPGVDDGRWTQAWDAFRAGMPAEIVDEHYYRPPDWFLQNAGRYDGYDRKGPKVFAGEYAAHRPDRKSTLHTAICEAAFMTGLLRNSDVVVMTSFAPLFNKDGFSQWTPDLVWCNNTQVFGTPSYHVQALFMQHRPDRTLPIAIAAAPKTPAASGRIGLQTWKTSAEFRDIRVTHAGQNLFTFDPARRREGWTDSTTGQWTVEHDCLRQVDADVTDTATCVGDTAWHDYTLTLKARKLAGSEGFILRVREKGNQYVHINLGGWGNRQHGLEQSEKGPLIRKPGRIAPNRWYDIRVVLKGERVSVWLDGEPLFDQVVPLMHTDPLYAVAGYDDGREEIVVTCVNPEPVPAPLTVRVTGARLPLQQARRITLSGAADAVNDFDHPDRISPVEEHITVSGSPFGLELPPCSLTILRIKAPN